MKKLKKGLRILFFLVALPVITMLASAGYWQNALPDTFLMIRGDSIHLPGRVRAVFREESEPLSWAIPPEQSAELYLPFGVPVKTVTVRMVDRESVLVSGKPFGIKMFTDGLMVVGMSDITVNGRRVNPGKEAGLKVGDILVSVDGVPLTTNEQIGRLVAGSQGRRMLLRYKRGEQLQKTWIDPIISPADGKYHIGIWVRDSSAGIGTITYFDLENRTFTGLGHPVCDIDTGEILSLSSGEAVEASIVGCSPSHSGTPGELKGRFVSCREFATLISNTERGVFGRLTEDCYPEGIIMPVALSHEVNTGQATILTTVDGTEPKEYDVKIEKVFRGSTKGQNMIIKITDPELLGKTGGICQGMSGSPLLQNGRIVGAVTHVFVNDPTRGYGIFIENMLDAAA